MPSPVFRDASYWTQNILGALIARAGISDVSNSSVAKTLSAALGQCLDEISYNCQNLQSVFSIDTAAGTDLDRRALDIIPGPLSRIPSQPASAALILTGASSGGAVTIPAGTQVSDAAGNVFATQEAATIPAGQTTIAGVAATAVLPGSQGNVGAGALTVFTSRPLGISSVTNPASATGGADAESDASFRQRIREYVAGIARGTVSALESAVLGAQDPITGDTILYAQVQEDPTTPGLSYLYIADAAGTDEAQPTAVTGEVATSGRLGPPPGSAQGGETQLALANRPVSSEAPFTVSSSTRGALQAGSQYTLNTSAGVLTFSPPLAQGEVITASYSYFTGVLALAQKIVDGDPTNRTAYPGIRAAGTQVIVAAPQILPEPISATLTIDPAYQTAQVQSAVTAAINSLMQGLPIGGNLILAELIASVMAVPGVVNVAFSQPSSDILAAPGQLIRPPLTITLH